jgi:hypothetical protein
VKYVFGSFVKRFNTQYYNSYIQNNVLSKKTENKKNENFSSYPNTGGVSFAGAGDFWKSKIVNNNTFSEQDKQMYAEILKNIDKQTKESLNKLIESGKILQRDSNDGSSTLENLYKILKNPRHQGLEANKILAQTINTIANPYIITQYFGDIPKEKVRDILISQVGMKAANDSQVGISTDVNDYNIPSSSCCVAASIEFSLADKKPAEFARMAEGLTNKDLEVKSKIGLDKITDKIPIL